MLLTEKEARFLHCPQALATDHRAAEQCKASRCMAWRQTDKYAMQNRKRVYKGYCGLAGRP